MAGYYDEQDLPSYNDAITEDMYYPPSHDQQRSRQHRNRSPGQQRRQTKSERDRRRQGDNSRHNVNQSDYDMQQYNQQDYYSAEDFVENDQQEIWDDSQGYYDSDAGELASKCLYKTPCIQSVTFREDPAPVHRNPPSKYSIPPAPSPLNGPYYQGKLRPEYQHMSGPPYPALHHLNPASLQTADSKGATAHSDSKGATAHGSDYGSGSSLRGNIHVRQHGGHATTVQYHPDFAPVTYIDSPDGEYGNDYMFLSIFNTLFCMLLGGFVGIALSYTVRHYKDMGDAEGSRRLSKATLGWNLATIFTSIIVIIAVFAHMFSR